ncbi:LD-carboxypeptidase [Panacibacter ginsenosidivorans]|uniref:LD-carboxypeptidase n=1 Tax=Panacibacter ginsenosidivorans TaxID=1813871 RepID=A0A5B8V5H4_9BACT|nr:LD-carboxypeptidase [Panacibacter ginsenosidivorans]QEC66462.1 LD-carboxypeptidase [Panacibacter ginsenosidivorans]
MIKIPPYLKKGDTIGIACPAGFMPAAKAQTCIETLHQWGFKVKIGKTLGNQFHYFSGTDEERLTDLQQMLDDTTVQAILCGRGGYGLSRIIDKIDFTKFKRNPKWIIGYSDVTVLHAHLYSKLKIASLHSPMAAAFNDGGANNEFVQSIKKAITGKKINYNNAVHELNREGTAEGELVGGNLSLICHLTGSASGVDTKNKILFLEDVGEYIYNIDRMFMQLKRAGRLDKLAGLIIGGFTEMKDTTIPFGQNVYEVIKDKVAEYNYPVCFGFPVSHSTKNYALKVGVKHKLSVSKTKVVLHEI